MRLVLLHALPLNGLQWSGQMNILPGATIAPTLYSFGDTLQDWAAGALEAAGNGPLIVVGNSVGGSCALEMARLDGGRIEALLLVEAKTGHRPEPHFRDQFIAALENDCDAAVREWVGGFLGTACDEVTREHILDLARIQNVDDLIRGVRVFHSRPDASDVLANWKKPLVLVRGERGGVALVHNSSPATTPQAAPPNQRTIVVPDCGHYVNLERPEAFNAILADVINSS